MAKCVGADMARVTAWAIVGGMMVAGEQPNSIQELVRKQQGQMSGSAGYLTCSCGILHDLQSSMHVFQTTTGTG